MVKFQLVQRALAEEVPNSLKKLLDDKIGGTNADLDKLLDFITSVVNIGIILAASAASIMVLDSAFQYVTAFGDESKAEKAKKTLTWSIVGLAVVGIAWLVKSVIENDLGNNPNIK